MKRERDHFRFWIFNCRLEPLRFPRLAGVQGNRKSKAKNPQSLFLPLFTFLLLALLSPALAHAEQRFPPPDFDTGHVLPTTVQTLPPSGWYEVADVTMLILMLAAAMWLTLRQRSRNWIVGLSLLAVAYFGFWRRGCVCPIGAIQNVTFALTNHTYILPLGVALFFLLPILAAFWAGRAFCSGVCPFGALQDLVLVRPITLPRWIDEGLGIIPYVYLGLAILLAGFGARFIICEYDPFIGIFRLAGSIPMLLTGAGLLAIGLFIGRPYCRFLCPYGAILRFVSRFAARSVRIAPQTCVNCRLCESSCPYGAIHRPVRPPTTPQHQAARRRVLGTLAAAPALILVGLAIGAMLGPALSSLHPVVNLASIVQKYDHDKAAATSPITMPDEVTAFYKTGISPAELNAQALGLRRRFTLAAALVGAFWGLVIAGRLLRLARRRGEQEYSADRTACVACGRCFEDCPKELQRRGRIAPVLVWEPRP